GRLDHPEARPPESRHPARRRRSTSSARTRRTAPLAVTPLPEQPPPSYDITPDRETPIATTTATTVITVALFWRPRRANGPRWLPFAWLRGPLAGSSASFVDFSLRLRLLPLSFWQDWLRFAVARLPAQPANPAGGFVWSVAPPTVFTAGG